MNLKSNLNDDASRLELALSVLVEEGGSFIFMARFIPTLKKHIPDSKTVNDLACGRTKSSALVKVVGRGGQAELAEDLKKQHFSIIVDESTDRTSTKFLVIHVRYYSLQKRNLLKSFLPCQNWEAMLQPGTSSIVEEFAKLHIPLKNMIGFASNNASVMIGVRGELAALLKEDRLVDFVCILSRFALLQPVNLSSRRNKEVPTFANDVYNFISSIQKELQNLRNLRNLLDWIRKRSSILARLDGSSWGRLWRGS